ncbi:putative serine/threonine-protein phosphatase 2A regulatory subunit B'' subunit TON2 [Zea mays]|uniref:Putative serine/threonine-protein phosphatase 2A regulatory subunit B'' subunit TON2 n=1 Tax=Zea mays TaxID=4577 RepID=A0A1D6EBL0_MAIZE|nr:putative serine/threonine-protein phosphatase 2A regulatory subunit B'' subunit TON2 [Zea mays]
MLWVRNIRRFVDTGAGLGSEAIMAVDFGGDSLGKKMVISEENWRLKGYCLRFSRSGSGRVPRLVPSQVFTRNLKKDPLALEFKGWPSTGF